MLQAHELKVRIYDVDEEYCRINLKQKIEIIYINKIKGYGVFATEDIAKDELTCFYPIDLITNVQPDISLRTAQYTVTIHDIDGYSIGNVIDIDNNEFPFMGHMINDGICIKLKENDTDEIIKKKIDIYNTIAPLRQNIFPFKTFNKKKQPMYMRYKERLYLPMYTTKPILAGHELFNKYGAYYWLKFN